MKYPTPPAIEHQDIWELLPWFVNGRLSEVDRVRVEAHLRICDPCRDELTSQRQIYRLIAAETAVEQMPAAGLNKLRQRIDAYEGGAAAAGQARTQSRSDALAAAGAAHLRRLPSAAVAASAAFIAVVFGVMGAKFWNGPQRHGGAAPYHTVTIPAPRSGNPVIRAVFGPSVRLSELQALLDDAQLRIVSGPTEAGVYSLATIGTQPLAWSLQRLRAHESVRFAETIGDPPSQSP